MDGDEPVGASPGLIQDPDDRWQLNRKQCAAAGALLFAIFAIGFSTLYVLLYALKSPPNLAERPGFWPVAGPAMLSTAVYLLVACPPMALFGALAGLLRYQMKCGTDDERAGGGGGFQALMAMFLLVIHFPVILAGLPLVIVDHLFGTRLWGDGTSGCIALLAGLLAAVCVVQLAVVRIPLNSSVLPSILFSCAADSLLVWLVSRWHRHGRLAESRERAITYRFSLRALLLSVLGLGAYLTILSYVCDW